MANDAYEFLKQNGVDFLDTYGVKVGSPIQYFICKIII